MKHANLFVDEIELEALSGDGGDGMVGFRREKFIAMGGPNGGDGGRGGDVVLVADTNVPTLLDLKSAKTIRAASGAKGGTSNKKGASGADIEVQVPVGTLVFDLDELDTWGGSQSGDSSRLANRARGSMATGRMIAAPETAAAGSGAVPLRSW